MPDQFARLTPGELMLLQEHRHQEIARAQEIAAFSGYCAGQAFAMAWSGDLKSFEEFYRPSEPLSGEELESECAAKGLKQPDQI